MTWIFDPDAAGYAATLADYFRNGGNLWLLQDDVQHDPLGALLGIPTPTFSGVAVARPTNGVGPIYDGPFGPAADVLQIGTIGSLTASDVTSHNGTVAGTAANGDNVVAVWHEHDYAPTAGRMVIATDVDSTGLSVFAPANSNAIWSLNTIAFLIGGTVYDSVAPAASCSVSTNSLWPPDGQTAAVGLTGRSPTRGRASIRRR